MTTDLYDSAFKALKKLETPLTRNIIKDAIKAGWPKEYALLLRVRVTKNEIIVSYPDEHAEAIGDLEYGSTTAGAVPVIRNFVKKNKDVLANAVADAALSWFVEAERKQ
jgi:hypothetical protein